MFGVFLFVLFCNASCFFFSSVVCPKTLVKTLETTECIFPLNPQCIISQFSFINFEQISSELSMFHSHMVQHLYSVNHTSSKYVVNRVGIAGYIKKNKLTVAVNT